MSISVRLYGNLRELANELDNRSGTIGLIDVESERAGTVAGLLNELGLNKSKISHVFVNNKYSSIEKTINQADEVAIFPTDMGLLYHWYFEDEK